MPKSLPQTLTLLKSVQLPERYYSVCYHNGNTYAGCAGGVVNLIDQTYKVTKGFIKWGDRLDGVRVYNNTLYVLGYYGTQPYFRVSICDLSGKHIMDWAHTSETCNYTNKLTIISNQVIIPDRSNNRLTVYTLDGEIIKHIPCTLSNTSTGIWALGTDSVVISQYKTSKVFRLDISTSEVVWTSNAVPKPLGIVSYGVDFVCVVSCSTKKICILNAKTGEWELNYVVVHCLGMQAVSTHMCYLSCSVCTVFDMLIRNCVISLNIYNSHNSLRLACLDKLLQSCLPPPTAQARYAHGSRQLCRKSKLVKTGLSKTECLIISL